MLNTEQRGRALWQAAINDRRDLTITSVLGQVATIREVAGPMVVRTEDARTGAERWSWKGDGPGYGSPVVAEFGKSINQPSLPLVQSGPSDGTVR